MIRQCLSRKRNKIQDMGYYYATNHIMHGSFLDGVPFQIQHQVIIQQETQISQCQVAGYQKSFSYDDFICKDLYKTIKRNDHFACHTFYSKKFTKFRRKEAIKF